MYTITFQKYVNLLKYGSSFESAIRNLNDNKLSWMLPRSKFFVISSGKVSFNTHPDASFFNCNTTSYTSHIL